MGLKYIEMIKTVTLIFLIGLSLVLTFLIWNSAPYDTIGRRETVDISITEDAEKKDIASVVKPYKIHFNLSEGITGTTDSEQMNGMVTHLKRWRLSNPVLGDKSFNENTLNQFLRRENQAVFYFSDEIPLPVYESLLNIENPNVPEIGFDLIVVEWNLSDTVIDVHFIDRENELRYQSTTKMYEPQAFIRDIITVGRSYDEYAEVNPDGDKFIVVPTNEVKLIQNTYFPNEKDEINPTRFRSALFSDPNAVRRNAVSATREEFQDNHALMTVDTEKKILQFVHPIVESRELAIPSELLEDAIDFLNEHGGWTDEYRFSNMNFKTRYVNFKLYVRGIPVLGGNTLTEIEQVWGDESVYQYKRPYYTLGETLPSETEIITLPSGKEVVDALMISEDIDFNEIEEIHPAYYMQQDVALNIFVLEPSWYYKQNGKWYRFVTGQVGGDRNGLE